MKTITFLVAFAAFAASGANYPLGTYIYVGSVMGFRNAVEGADAGLTIQAVSTNGTVLASCPVVDADATGCNYRLEVPVSSSATDKSAAIGDTLNCVVVSAAGARAAATSSFPAVDAASAVVRCDITYVNAQTFPYEGGTVQVPEDYLAGIAYWMARGGYAEYDAGADWDGDGASNYAEYVAGTNPFDRSDYLRITAISASPTANVIAFEYVGGHLYALKSAETLSNPGWTQTAFRTDPAAATQSLGVFQGPGDEDVGRATLYVTPAADAPQMFYKVEVK